MKLQALLTTAFLALAALACAPSSQAVREGEEPAAAPERKPGETARASLMDSQGQPVGEVTFQETPHGVLVRGTLSHLPPGTHAFHIHETGKCEGPEFKTAGGHFNPHHKAHGMMAPGGKHAGDLPNLFVGQDGRIQFEFFANQGLTLRSMMDADGAAVVVHAQGDDHQTDPTGDAGGRIACGVVTQ
jgi:superoxide dismutase, Cu-Zn family